MTKIGAEVLKNLKNSINSTDDRPIESQEPSITFTAREIANSWSVLVPLISATLHAEQDPTACLTDALKHTKRLSSNLFEALRDSQPPELHGQLKHEAQTIALKSVECIYAQGAQELLQEGIIEKIVDSCIAEDGLGGTMSEDYIDRSSNLAAVRALTCLTLAPAMLDVLGTENAIDKLTTMSEVVLDTLNKQLNKLSQFNITRSELGPLKKILIMPTANLYIHCFKAQSRQSTMLLKGGQSCSTEEMLALTNKEFEMAVNQLIQTCISRSEIVT